MSEQGCQACEYTGWYEFAHFCVPCWRCDLGRVRQHERDLLELKDLKQRSAVLRKRVKSYESAKH